MKIALSSPPEIVERPAYDLIYVQTVGPFEKLAPGAWESFWSHASALDRSTIRAMLGLSFIDPEKEGDDRFVYQAGVAVSAVPTSLPNPLKSRTVAAGKFARFLLTGSYAQLGQAYPLAFQAIQENGLCIRTEFCAESYLNDPSVTPEAELLTEILIPVA